MRTFTFKIGEKQHEIPETLADRLIGYLSPMRGHTRMMAKLSTAVAFHAIGGGYEGASLTKRSLKSWVTTPRDADAELLPDLDVLRHRSGHLYNNAPISTAAINTMVTNVVGTGMQLQSTINRKLLGMTEEEAREWENNTEDEWRLWSENPDCSITRNMDFPSFVDMAFRGTIVRGDILVLMPSIPRSSTPYQLTLQAIESDRLSNPGFKTDTPHLSGGVEKDDFGAPLAYHVQTTHPGSIVLAVKREWIRILAFGEKTGRRNALHIFRVLRPGQTRGVPFLAPVIDTLKQIDRYTEAEIMAAVVAGFLTVFLKTKSAVGLGSLPQSVGGVPTSDEELKLGNGAIIGLRPDEEVQVVDPKRPNAEFDPFMTSMLRHVGAALEIPFEILVKHFTSSYSASRAALVEAWKMFLSRRVWLTRCLIRPVYEQFIAEAVTLGRISAPGFFTDAAIRKAYLEARWTGPARGQIDELREVKAARERIDGFFSTVAAETAQMTGQDWQKNHDQLVREKAARIRDGIEVGATPTPPAETPSGNITVPSEPENEDL